MKYAFILFVTFNCVLDQSREQIFYYCNYSNSESRVHFTWVEEDSFHYSSFMNFKGEFESESDKYELLNWYTKVPSNFDKYPYYKFVFKNGQAFIYSDMQKRSLIYDSLKFIGDKRHYKVDSNRIVVAKDLLVISQISPLCQIKKVSNLFYLYKSKNLVVNKQKYYSNRDISTYNYDTAFIEYYAFNRNYGYIPLKDTLELNQLIFSIATLKSKR